MLWKIRNRRQIKNTDNLHKLDTTQKKQTIQKTAEQNYPDSVAFYNTRPGNEVGLFYNASEPTHD